VSWVRRRAGGVAILLVAVVSGLVTARPETAIGSLQADAGYYRSPNFGFEVTYDADVWEISDEASGNGEDYVIFLNGPSFLTLNATAGYGGDVVSCRDDWARSLRRIDGVTDFRPMVDDDGNEQIGEDGDSAFGVYTYASEEGDEIFDLECRELIPDAVNLVIILETHAEVYDEERAAAGDFLDGLVTDNVVGAAPAGGTGTPGAPGGSGEREPVDPNEVGVDLILLVDTFERSERSLLSTTTPDPSLVRYAYEGGEFVIETLADDAGAWHAGLPNVYREVSIAVDATFASEPGGRYVKVACRSNTTAGGLNEYSLLLDPRDGFVSLDSWVDDERIPLYEAVRPDVVNLARETNRIELSCFGDRIEALHNRTVVVTVEKA